MSAKGLFINSAQNGFTVEGADNVLYPDNGVLFFPFNSVIAVVDDGDIATFRSAYNNDVLFSGLIENITIDGNSVRKEDVVDAFADVANKESGGGGGDTSGLFAGASYDSVTKHINFYNEDDELLTYIDATAFIKDGMVDTVAIQNGNLVITFNTDAGKQPISIPLTDIFNPNNYYTKSQVDALIPTDVSDLNNDAGYITQAEVVINESYPSAWLQSQDMEDLIQAINDDSDAVVGKVYMDTISLSDLPASMQQAEVKVEIMSELEGEGKVLLFTVTSSNTSPYHWEYTSAYGETGTWRSWANASDLANYYTKTQVDTALSAKANSADLATVATSGDYDDLSNKPTIPTVPTNVSAFTNDAGYLTQHQSLSNYYTKSEVDAELSDKQDTLTAGTGITIDANNVISATGGGGDYVDVPTFNQKEVAIAQALTDLNENKADKTELPDTSTFATKTELNAKQNTLTAGTGISIQNDVISATGGGGASYQFYNETDEEQEEGTTINRHKSGVIEITDEGGTIDSGMGTSYEEIEEDGSISYTNVSSSMYADKDDGETVNGATIAVTYDSASMTVSEDGEDNGTEYSKYTDFIVNPDGFTVEINEDGNTAASIGFNKNLGLYKHNIDEDWDEGFVTSVGSIERIMKVTQSDYDDMAENDDIDPNTLYIIVSNI